jgi:hypothetical protein
VLSELWGTPDRRLVLRVPPGRYVVQKRVGGLGGIAQIAIAEGEERRLEERDFASSSLEMLASKGGSDSDRDRNVDSERQVRSNHELSAGYDVGFTDRTGLLHGPRAAWAYAWTNLALTIGGGADFSSRSLADKTESLTGGYGRLGVELRLPLGSVVMLRGGLGGRAGVLAQTITPTASAPFGSKEESKNTLAFGPEIVLAVRLSFSRAVFADLGATGFLSFVREEDVLRGIPAITGAASLGTRF